MESNVRLRLAMYFLLVWFAFSVTGCSTRNPFLAQALNAPTEAAFDEAIRLHGPVDGSESATIYQVAMDGDEQQRRNAATLFIFCRASRCLRDQQRLLQQTNDLKVWAITLHTLLQGEQPIADYRPTMIKQALQSTDGEVWAAGLQAGLLIEMPTIETELSRGLTSGDSKVLAVVLPGLSPAMARDHAPWLAAMLADPAAFATLGIDIDLALTVVRTGDPAYYPAIARYLDWLESEGYSHHFFNAATFSDDPAVQALLWAMVRTPADSENALAAWRNAAYGSLATQVWAPTLRRPATVALLELTATRLAAASQETDPRTHPHGHDDEAERLIAFLASGDTEWEHFLHGADALAFARHWLAEHK